MGLVVLEEADDVAAEGVDDLLTSGVDRLALVEARRQRAGHGVEHREQVVGLGEGVDLAGEPAAAFLGLDQSRAQVGGAERHQEHGAEE